MQLIWLTKMVALLWNTIHDDFVKWQRLPHYWPFVRGVRRGPMDSCGESIGDDGFPSQRSQQYGALMFPFILARKICWKNCRWFATPLRLCHDNVHCHVPDWKHPVFWLDKFLLIILLLDPIDDGRTGIGLVHDGVPKYATAHYTNQWWHSSLTLRPI